MKRSIVVCCLLATALCCTGVTGAAAESVNKGKASGTVQGGTAEQQLEVAKAADGFLKQLDAGAFELTWAQASPHLHGLSSEAEWLKLLRLLRAAVGKFQGRTLTGVGFTDTVDRVPPGEYVAVQFTSEFSAVNVKEDVVMHKDSGQWKVMGYFLSKPITVWPGVESESVQRSR